MFHPVDRPMERGWVGRVDGDRVIHLAAQTLQHFFTGGASAREHAEYPLVEIAFTAPVLHPPAVRVFEDAATFAFANPAAVVGPGATVAIPAADVVALPRLAALVAEDEIVAYGAVLELRAPALMPPKDRDFGIAFGPVVVTPDEVEPERLPMVVGVDGGEWWSGTSPPFDWGRARAYAAAGTTLRTGDILVGPPAGELKGLVPGSHLACAVDGIGELMVTLA
jgi:hypothetical protein